jgi:ATP-dependent protease HslVU (ClpYQ) peptidase subunit
MTTVLADAKLGVMVSDSSISDGTRVWSGKKVHRVRGHLIGLAGSVPQTDSFLAWYKRGGDWGKWHFKFDESYALILTPEGLFEFDQKAESLRHVDPGYEAIGSGAMAAIAAHDALCRQDPKKAVQIACKHDAGSRPPVRLYRL